MNRQRVVVGACCTVLALVLFGFLVLKTNTPTGATPNAVCASDIHFYAYDVTPNFFGPASESDDVQAQKNELHNRRCADPALLVSHLEYWAHSYSTPEQREVKVQGFVDNRDAWRQAVDLLEAGEATCQATLPPPMSGSYQTLWMRKGADANVIPAIFQASPDRPEFKVLRFDCAGKQFSYKLDCGFQPVAQEFPGVPGESQQPVPTTPVPTTPVTRPPTNSTVPTPTTRVTVPPTSPPTTGCPTGPNGCKDPNDGINHDPGACSLGDCGPRPVDPTPPPADPVQPTATVAPPATTQPPPAPLPQPQPTVTTPVTTGVAPT